jgi:DNA-binding response OmpR family regulator
MRLLLVEDDTLLGEGVRAGLAQDGYTVDWVRTGLDARHALDLESYALVVLDLGLPGVDGLDLLRELRRKGNRVPVLILTARDSVADRVSGLDTGGDDYLVKPFDLHELLARVRSLLRRSSGRAAPGLTIGDVEIDPAGHRVTRGGAEVALSRREFGVLLALAQNRGRVLSREQLESALYGWDDEFASNTIEVYVHHLRKKLGEDIVRTVRGVGYTMPKEQP